MKRLFYFFMFFTLILGMIFIADKSRFIASFTRILESVKVKPRG